MFETLFCCPRTIASYRIAPLFEERSRCLSHCAKNGLKRDSLRRIAHCQLDLIRITDLQANESLEVVRIEEVADILSQSKANRFKRKCSSATRKRFVAHATGWMRFLDCLSKPPVSSHPYCTEIASFKTYARKERGWSETTIDNTCDFVARFLIWMDNRGVALTTVSIVEVDDILMQYQASHHWSRSTVRLYATHLRRFFHYAYREGLCATPISEGIMPHRHCPSESVNKGLNRTEVRSLLATTDSDRPVDKRDHAILMLLSTYGLRAGEVCSLTLDDLHWSKMMLQVHRSKVGQVCTYPLSDTVAESIAIYLQQVRPTAPVRTLFLAINAPFRQLRPTAVSTMVFRRLSAIGINAERKRGAHTLRHATAQLLLDHDTPMKVIADYLGHQSIASTSTYAKFNMNQLREVAAVNLEGLL